MSETQYAGSFTMTMDSTASNIDFFRGTLSDDACANWRVTINDIISEQKANNLTFSEGDVIKIEYDTNEAVFHPGSSVNSDTYQYILSIKGSLPIYTGNSNDPTTGSTYVFGNCHNLQEISEELFFNWKNVIDFTDCFAFCSQLISIPENLFSKNVAVTNFQRCFRSCTSITSVPKNLFINNIEVTDFNRCFSACQKLNLIIFIKSTKVTNVDFFGYGCKGIGTVYVPSESLTYTTFSSSRNSGVNVISLDPINISDEKLISMVLVDDENNRTTFNGPIINDFTITEDLQSKINQLTTLATNISNLQTRLTNITNILNTQNIEFYTSGGFVPQQNKLFIYPKVSITLNILAKDYVLNISKIFTDDISIYQNKTYSVELKDISLTEEEFKAQNKYIMFDIYRHNQVSIDEIEPLNITSSSISQTVKSISIGDTLVYQYNDVSNKVNIFVTQFVLKNSNTFSLIINTGVTGDEKQINFKLISEE